MCVCVCVCVCVFLVAIASTDRKTRGFNNNGFFIQNILNNFYKSFLKTYPCSLLLLVINLIQWHSAHSIRMQSVHFDQSELACFSHIHSVISLLLLLLGTMMIIIIMM